MKIRSFLIVLFTIATLIPTLIFSAWSYHIGVKREFTEVEDRHLLIAQNLSFALERYQQDVVAAFESVSATLTQGASTDAMKRLLRQLNMLCILNVDKKTGEVRQQMATFGHAPVEVIDPALMSAVSNFATPSRTVFSNVMENKTGENVLYLIRDFGTHYAIGEISTRYFVRLGKSISFGIRGHAAIVDQFGNVLAHPREDWIASRKNISQVSSVARMMNGETGIEEFYSPALKGNMIAGLTSVPGPGWGVMVPQPISEIYDKVYANRSSVFLILAIALAGTLGLGLLFARSLSAPLERLATVMKTNARERQLRAVESKSDLFPFEEIKDFRDSYNTMVHRVTESGRKIEALAFSDTITGLPNRAHLQSVAAPILAGSKHGTPGGIMVLIDLDNFKEVNDLHGHDAGDQLLRVCASQILKVTGSLQVRESKAGSEPLASPVVSRIGGDEFIIMVQGLVDEDEIQAFLDVLRAELASPVHDLPFTLNKSASIGCSRFPQDAQDVEELIKRADIAMYHAKNSGKNRSELYSPEIGARSTAEIRRDVLDAIDTDGFFLEYQPKICAHRQKVCGVEALVRWNHPEYGRFMPDYWLPAIANSPAISALGEWVVKRAMKDQMALAKAGQNIFMSVNIGPGHFVTPGFVESVDAIRNELGFDAQRLEIEVTEDALFVSEDQAVEAFKRLHKSGYRVSIDDFGKGYSNIARLARLPVDFLKIDRSIIVGAFEDDRIRAILESTFDMARKLDCKTVAEGVETLQHAEFATRLGANCLQGYYFAKSMPLDELNDWLSNQSRNSVHAYHERLKQAV